MNLEAKLEFIRPALLNQEGIQSWFTMRNPEYCLNDARVAGFNLGMFTAEEEDILAVNMAILSSVTKTDELNMAITRQVHSNNIAVVDSGGLYEEVDGLVSSQSGLLLSIQVADCAAILIGDPVHKVIGAAHAGWRGASSNVLPNLVQKMKKLGASTEHCFAYISPCIAIESFEVGEEVAEQFPEAFVDRHSYPKPHVNLKSFLKNQLVESGMKEGQIEVDASCTMTEKDKFYSYRRDGKNTGRMMALIKVQKTA